MARSDSTDEALALEARWAAEGDLAAFDVLVQRHQSSIAANCRYMTRSAEDAEDLAQEVFVKAYFGLAGFEGRSRFKTWLQRIKINHCLNFIEKRAGKTFVNIEDPQLADSPALAVGANAERELLARTDRERIDAVLDSLSDTIRVPLVMREMDAMSYEEIAEALGIGLSAVKMRIKRGREEFCRRFDQPDAGTAAVREPVLAGTAQGTS